MQLLPFGFVQHSVIAILYVYYISICVYASRALRQMLFGSLGSPSKNKAVIIILITRIRDKRLGIFVHLELGIAAIKVRIEVGISHLQPLQRGDRL